MRCLRATIDRGGEDRIPAVGPLRSRPGTEPEPSRGYRPAAWRMAQTVEVTAAAPLVDTRSPALSSLVDDRRVQDLPINGRNVIKLAVTLPASSA